jgi:hypothetical protein
MAGLTGLEPATSGVTGRRCNRLYYSPLSTETKKPVSIIDMELRSPTDFLSRRMAMQRR